MAKNYLIMNEANTINGLSINEVDGKTVITAPAKAKYLNEFMLTLPSGILNKKETGCGATSVVLENQEDVIICCPTIQLIISKVSQYPNNRCPYYLHKVMKGVKNKDIEEYIQICKEQKQPVKIMTTYDSFPKVAAIVGEDISKYKIVVDEYQEILDIAIYRNKAVKTLLHELKGMSNVTYLSATPIELEYTPKELKELPYFEIKWPEQTKVKPLMIQSNSPFSSVVNIIRNHKAGRPIELDGKQVAEYFFFVNSVTAIKRII